MKHFCNYYQNNNSKKSLIKIEEPTYVFLTAFCTPNFKAHAKTLGVELIFEKPIGNEDLNRILMATMNRGEEMQKPTYKPQNSAPFGRSLRSSQRSLQQS